MAADVSARKERAPSDKSVVPLEFNVAVPFIERHLDEGRSEKIIIHATSGEKITYEQLSEKVNQTGNVLKKIGLNPGDRILMVVKDSPEFFYLFWGAIKAGFIPVPLNTLFRSNDYTGTFHLQK